MRKLSCTLLAIWPLFFSLPLAMGSFLVNNAGYCSLNEFWYEPIRECIPLGKQSFQSAPPYGITCPSGRNWYWSSRWSACLPSTPVSGSVSCLTHHIWDTATNRCILVEKTQGSTTCSAAEFWFSERRICLPHRDASFPTSSLCPSRWYWSAELLGCVPSTFRALASPTCYGDHVWSLSALMCQRPASLWRRTSSGSPSPSPSPSRGSSPSPSPAFSRRQNLKSRTLSLCPAGLDACPISSDLSEYECVDPKYDLQHCGGCSTDGRGQDCTLIRGVWNVACAKAQCSGLGIYQATIKGAVSNCSDSVTSVPNLNLYETAPMWKLVIESDTKIMLVIVDGCARTVKTSGKKSSHDANPPSKIMADNSAPVTLRTRKFITNRLLNRRQFVVDILHPSRPNVAKSELQEKLAGLYKSEKDRVVLFGIRTHFGGGRSTGFAFIYDDEASQRKFEPKYRLIRNGLEAKVDKPSRKLRHERKNRAKKVRGTKKSKAAEPPKKGK